MPVCFKNAPFDSKASERESYMGRKTKVRFISMYCMFGIDKKIIILGTPFLVAEQGKISGFSFLAGHSIRVHVT